MISNTMLERQLNWTTQKVLSRKPLLNIFANPSLKSVTWQPLRLSLYVSTSWELEPERYNMWQANTSLQLLTTFFCCTKHCSVVHPQTSKTPLILTRVVKSIFNGQNHLRKFKIKDNRSKQMQTQTIGFIKRNSQVTNKTTLYSVTVTSSH